VSALSIRSKKVIVATLFVAGIATALGHSIFFMYLEGHRPIMPVPNSGLVVQESNHGYKFYVTIHESRELDALFDAFFPFVLLAAWLRQRWEISKKCEARA
jgi:hypothetical protein